MILTIGEILIDKFAEEGKEPLLCAGGAPFNAAYAAMRAGASVAFCGRVGADANGDYLRQFASQFPFYDLEMQIDPVRATTVACVTLAGGERAFKFLRDNTADLFFDQPQERVFEKADIIELGTLMLSDPFGQEFYRNVTERAHVAGKLVAVDANFRDDIFGARENMLLLFEYPIASADIVKFSDDEICMFMGTENIDKALIAFAEKYPDKFLAVTQGKYGSHAVQGQKTFHVPSVPAENVVDTTGAGDAFFGTLLAGIDLAGGVKGLSESRVKTLLAAANAAGADAVTYKGAIRV